MVSIERHGAWPIPAHTDLKETKQMGIEVILGCVAFAGLFGLWVVLPSKLRKSREE